jgi:hypothetical protein
VPESTESTGCRGVSISTAILLGTAIVFIFTGLLLTNAESCDGVCETVALTALYAGGPISAAIGVFFGGVWVAWPLEITLWVVIAFISARWAERRDGNVVRLALIIVAVALVYGLVLSQLVEIAV